MPGLTDEEEERIEPTPHVAANIDKLVPLVAKDGKIDKAEERMTKARNELGNIYQGIEKDLHGNRKAVKLVRTLLAGTTDAAYDFMRTFLPLAHRFKLVPEDDLVDLAAKVEASDGGDTDEAEGDGVSVADLAPKSHFKKAAEPKDDAISRHVEALKTGGKPPAPKGPPGDLDLADAGSDVADEIAAQRAKDAESFDEARVTH